MKKTYMTLLLAAVALLASAAAPNGSGTYYKAANGKKGAELKTALCGIIYDRTEKSYDYLWTAFFTTDVRSDGKIWDMYSNITNYEPVTSGSTYSVEGDCYNREHSFPQSWFGGEVMPMYTDLHHMYPTDGYVNNRRGNLPFGEVSNPTYSSSGGFSKVGPCSYSGYTGKVFEPNDEYKGDFARTYFYMVTCYEEKLHDWFTTYSSTDVVHVIDGTTYPAFQTWQLNMLLKWAAKDPVSAKETARNNAVYGIQKNRNPFIDYPGLEQYIWGSKTDVAFSYDNYVQPDGSSSGSGTGGDEPDPGTDPGSSSYFTRITSMDDFENGGTYLIVCESESKAFNGTLTTLDAVNNNISVTISDHTIEATTSIMASTFTITAKTGGYSVRSASGYYIGNTAKSNGLKCSRNDSYTNDIAFNIQGNVYIESNSTYLYFNKNVDQSRFRYFTSSQQDIQLYKLVGSTSPSPTPSDLALTGAPVALSFDLYNNASAQTVTYTTSSTGAVTVSGGDGYVTTSVSGNAITVTPTSVTPSAQTITVSQAADGTHKAGSVTFTVTVSDSTPVASNGWVETSIADLTASDVFVIVGTHSQGTFALPNVEDTKLATVRVTVADGVLTSEVTDNLKWNISGNATNGYSFYPNGITSKWLYCGTTNNSGSNDNIRVGTENRKVFELNSDGYLVTKDKYTPRYLCVYSGADWRGYVQANIIPTTIKFYKYVPSQTVSVGDTGYATMVADANLVIPSGVQAFAVQVKPGYASAYLVPVTDGIPQGEAVVIKASEGTYNFLYTSNQVDAIEENDLVPATMAVTADGSQYCLAYKNNTVGFYRVQEGVKIPEGKAYLEVKTATGGEAPEFYGFSDEDDATSINEELRIKNEELEGAVYNLAGQQIVNCKSSNRKLPRGIYIKNGRKVLK